MSVELPPPVSHPDSDSGLQQSTVRLGERLVARGLLTEDQLRQALEVQSRTQGFLGQVLVDLGFVRAVDIGGELEAATGVRYVDVLSSTPEANAVALLPEQLVRESRALPLRVLPDGLEVAMVDPLDVSAIDRIHLQTGLRVVPVLTMEWEFRSVVNELFDAYQRASAALEELQTADDASERARPPAAELAGSDAPIVRLVSSLLDGAIAVRASDIHFEPQANGLRVRYRVDGSLMHQANVPRAQQAALIARLKVLANMDVTETRRPQDGRMSYEAHGRSFDLRLSAVPTAFGEKIVLRILDKASVVFPLAQLGFEGRQQRAFEAIIRQPYGLVIVVGPTGSGKSTTLYSALNTLNDATRNIVTLEDPVEYFLPGLNQVQVNPRVGLTFANGLRTLVRQDPDVILVGEIRDQETAEMAMQASLTGHLVLTTLHTNSAVGSITRLQNLGVDRFLIAQSLAGVVSQRLVARICTHCSAPYAPAPAVLSAVGITPREASTIQFRRGRGCRVCYGRGYSGRCGVFEVVPIDDELVVRILEGTSEAQLQREVQNRGICSLRDAALALVRSGITTPEELGRVVLTKGV